MAEGKGLMCNLLAVGLILAFFILYVPVFFERWKEILVVTLFWFVFSGKRYRFLYAACCTFSRDVRAIMKHSLTVLGYFYWKSKRGGIVRIFLSKVQKHPNKIAFHFGDETWTFQQVEDESNRMANYFKAQGVKRGDTVGLFMESRPQVVFTWLGLSKIGAITALINTHQRASVLSHSLKAGECSRVVCGTELVDALKEVLVDFPSLKVYVSGAGKMPSLPNSVDLDKQALLAPTTSLPEEIDRIDMQDNILLIFTSGTTGLPKAAKITHTRFFMMARVSHNALWMRSDDIVYDTLPLYHTAGGMVGVGQALINGLTVVIRSKFSVSNFWTDCIKYNCTIVQYIGEMCRFLLAAPKKREDKSHKVRLLLGIGMKAQIWQAFVDRFNIQQVGEIYGATEGNCSMVNTENVVGAVGFLPWFASVFNPYFLIKADPETNEPIRNNKGFCIECDYGEPGILVGGIKANPFSQFSGYSDKKSTESKILRDVFKKGDMYFNSGDILVKDEFGNFFFKDRTGDTYRWRGENVATTEVEDVISNVVGLKDAIVYGVEIPKVEGKAGMVGIVDRDGSLDLKVLAEGVRKSLPAYARPLFVRILRDVPLTETFKLQKSNLKKEGYNPLNVKDPLYFFDGTAFVTLSEELYKNIINGNMKL